MQEYEERWGEEFFKNDDQKLKEQRQEIFTAELGSHVTITKVRLHWSAYCITDGLHVFASEQFDNYPPAAGLKAASQLFTVYKEVFSPHGDERYGSFVDYAEGEQEFRNPLSVQKSGQFPRVEIPPGNC